MMGGLLGGGTCVFDHITKIREYLKGKARKRKVLRKEKYKENHISKQFRTTQR